MILIAPLLLRYFAGKRVAALAFFPFIFVRDERVKCDPITIRHEKIHWRQQLELLLVGFYFSYVVFYLYYRMTGYNHVKAYYKIPFEKEAYSCESDRMYLEKRRVFAWFNFLYA